MIDERLPSDYVSRGKHIGPLRTDEGMEINTDVLTYT